MKVRGNELKFTAERYLLQFALPNLFFHVTTAYGVLRHSGVPVGKLDYLGTLLSALRGVGQPAAGAARRCRR